MSTNNKQSTPINVEHLQKAKDGFINICKTFDSNKITSDDFLLINKGYTKIAAKHYSYNWYDKDKTITGKPIK